MGKSSGGNNETRPEGEMVWRPNDAIGSTIRAIRSRLGMSQQDLAKYLGAPGSQSQISLWENGKHRPSPDALRRIAELVDAGLAIFQYPEEEFDRDASSGASERPSGSLGSQVGPTLEPGNHEANAPEVELLAFLAERVGWPDLARELIHNDLLTTAYAIALRERWGRFELTRLDRLRDRILERHEDE